MVTQSFLWGGSKKSVYVEFKNHKCQIDVNLTTFCLRARPPKNLLSNFVLEDVKSTVKISKMLISQSNFLDCFKFGSTMSSTGPAAKLTRKQFDCNCLKVLLETYAQKRIFDASFEGNKGENGSNKTISELFQERIEPAMLEWYHFYFQDCLNSSQQISITLGSLKTVTI